MTNSKVGATFGRPVIKPKRKSQTMLINEPYINDLQKLQLQRVDTSLSDLHNEALALLFKKYPVT